jgi:hypothetical protein
MPDTDRTARGYDIVRSLRRWLPFPKKRQPPALEPDAAEASVLRARPAEQGGAPLLWCHADSAEELEPLAGLLHRLREETDTLEFLLTSRGLLSKKVLGDQFPDGVTLGNCPSEDPAAIRRFLDRRRPDICLWVGSSYAPHLIVATVEDGIPVINVNASFPKNIWRRARVVRRSLRQLMEKFQAIYPLDTPSREGLLKFGLADGLVLDAGELRTLPAVPSHDEALRTQLGLRRPARRTADGAGGLSGCGAADAQAATGAGARELAGHRPLQRAAGQGRVEHRGPLQRPRAGL